ncbi:unnamed protein product [Arctogadus glacialis]
MSTKKHRAMGSEEWVSRLKAFASSGTWPSSAGNRPSPKQAKWHNLYQKSVRSPAATSASTSAAPARSPGRPALTLAMFEKTRFGGTLSAAAKPNVNLTRRPAERPSSPATVPAGHSIRYPTSSDAPFQSQLLQACLPFLSASIQPCHVGGEDQLFSSGCIRYESCSSRSPPCSSSSRSVLAAGGNEEDHSPAGPALDASTLWRNQRLRPDVQLWRRTRGEEATIRQVEALLQELIGDKGRDLLGVPLLDRVRMEHIWRVQKRHVKCIQDLPASTLES